MTPELKAAVERSYKVFGRYRLSGDTLCVCRCPCCMSETYEKALIATPLREIPAEVLAEYTNSAHGWNDGQIATEFRYFLPRYLELIAAYDPPQYWGLEFCLSRMGHAAWQETWPGDETAAINGFFEAFLRDSLMALQHERHKHASLWSATFDVEDVFLLVAHAGGDIDHLLTVWEKAPDPSAAVNMAMMRHKIAWRNGTAILSVWWKDDDIRANGHKIAAFLLRPEVDRRLEDAVVLTQDREWQLILSDALTRPKS